MLLVNLMKKSLTAFRRKIFLCIPVFLFLSVPLEVTGLSSDAIGDGKVAGDGMYIRKLPEPMGFAFTGAGTTGGEGGIEVTVTTAEDLLKYASSDDPYIINVVDTIEIVRGIGNFSETNGSYHLGSNTTLRGIGANATIMYGGFLISNKENIIIQNLTFDGTFVGIHNARSASTPCSQLAEGEQRYKNGPCLGIGEKGPTDDAIEITNGSERIWVTQVTIKRYSDEMISAKREASLITLSWNRFDDKITGDRGMAILLGHSHSHTADRGRLRVTIHHNYLAGGSRHPYARFGIFHLFNNYLHNIGQSGITSATEAQTLVENNHFENVNNPWRISDSSGEHIGYLVERNNIIVNTRTGPTRGRLNIEVPDPAFFYDYNLDNPEYVRDLVLSGAGPGVGEFLSVMPVAEITNLIYPVDDELVSRNPAFSWKRSAMATAYDVQILEGTGEGATVVAEATVPHASFAHSGLLDPDKTYSWRVRATNRDDEGTWTDYESFITGTEVEHPEAVVLVSPIHESTEVSTMPVFSWQKETHAASYRFELAKDAGFNNVVAETEVSGNSISMTDLSDSLAYKTTYFWRVRAESPAGDSDWSEVWSFTTDEEQIPTGIADTNFETSDLPLQVTLDQNYPNPFNPNTVIRFQLPENSEIRLEVFDMLGRRVSVLVNETRNAGVHEVSFDASGLSSGLYLYRLQAGDIIRTQKMMLMK
jgi:pectate lyase